MFLELLTINSLQISIFFNFLLKVNKVNKKKRMVNSEHTDVPDMNKSISTENTNCNIDVNDQQTTDVSKIKIL